RCDGYDLFAPGHRLDEKDHQHAFRPGIRIYRAAVRHGLRAFSRNYESIYLRYMQNTRRLRWVVLYVCPITRLVKILVASERARTEPVHGEFINHATMGALYKPRQCLRHCSI